MAGAAAVVRKVAVVAGMEVGQEGAAAPVILATISPPTSRKLHLKAKSETPVPNFGTQRQARRFLTTSGRTAPSAHLPNTSGLFLVVHIPYRQARLHLRLFPQMGLNTDIPVLNDI